MIHVKDIADGWISFSGKLLQERRIAMGLSQDELGRVVYVSGSTVSVWENAERSSQSSLPNAEQIRKLCIVLRIDPRDLLLLSVTEE